YQGWPGIIHGGILCTVLDEAMGYALVFEGVLSYVTAKAEMRFRKQVGIGEPLVVTGTIDKRARNLIWTSAHITRKGDNSTLTEAKAVMFDTGKIFTP
ncbi:MAG: PaaI family thioesterase, partial [Dehalococcoidia bacterium]|nr:PaaI family thioesterase [Dehalococcoidia bacterium]